MKLKQSRGLPQMYGQLEEGWGLSALVFVHCSLCENYAVKGSSTDVWSIGGEVRSICHGYKCILLFMKLIWCSGFRGIYAQLE